MLDQHFSDMLALREDQLLRDHVPLHCLILQRLRRYFSILGETMSTGGGSAVRNDAVLWRKRHKTIEVGRAIFSGCPEPKSHRNKPSTPWASTRRIGGEAPG